MGTLLQIAGLQTTKLDGWTMAETNDSKLYLRTKFVKFSWNSENTVSENVFLYSSSNGCMESGAPVFTLTIFHWLMLLAEISPCFLEQSSHRGATHLESLFQQVVCTLPTTYFHDKWQLTSHSSRGETVTENAKWPRRVVEDADLVRNHETSFAEGNQTYSKFSIFESLSSFSLKEIRPMMWCTTFFFQVSKIKSSPKKIDHPSGICSCWHPAGPSKPARCGGWMVTQIL